MSRRLAWCLLLAITFVAGCTASSPSAATRQPDPVIDGYAIGPARDAADGAVFHSLETAARAIWQRTHQGQPLSGFALHHAGTLPGGTTQAGTDDATTYLMVITVAGGERHALVLHCSPSRTTGVGACS